MKVLLPLAVLAGVLATPVRAPACGATPDALWAFGGTFPAAGATDVPTDAVLAFEGRAFTDFIPERSGEELAGLMVVRLRELASGAEVAGKAEGFGWGKRPGALWRPSASLAPSTTYELEARIENNAPPMPEAITGPQVLRFTFTTGSAGAPALGLPIVPTAQREEYDHPVYNPTCFGVCGGPPRCGPASYVRRGRLRGELPAISGGWAPLGYQIAPFFVAGHPGEANHDAEVAALRRSPNTSGQMFLAAGTAMPFTLDVLNEAVSGPRCLYLRIREARGVVGLSEPICFDWAPPPPRSARSPSPPTTTSLETAGGCSVARGTAPGPVALLVMALATLLYRRRR